MKKIIIIFILILSFGYVNAERVTLDQPEALTPTTSSMLNWRISLVDAKNKILKVQYQWLDATGQRISFNRQAWSTWTCRDVADTNPEENNTECTAADTPYTCCTGVDTGTCDEAITCFSDIFGFQIRAQDVGTGIGIGLRTLIWNQMKSDVLTVGNDGVFE